MGLWHVLKNDEICKCGGFTLSCSVNFSNLLWVIFLLWFFLSQISFSRFFKLWHLMIIIHISFRKPLRLWPCEVSTRSLSLEASVMIQDLKLHSRPQSDQEVSLLYKAKIDLKLILLEFWRIILLPISSRHAMREKSELI